MKINLNLTLLFVALVFSLQTAFACGEQDAKAANVSNTEVKSDCPYHNTTQEAAAEPAGIPVVQAGFGASDASASSCSSGGSCNMMGVLSAFAIGMVVMFGGVLLTSKMKI